MCHLLFSTRSIKDHLRPYYGRNRVDNRPVHKRRILLPKYRKNVVLRDNTIIRLLFVLLKVLIAVRSTRRSTSLFNVRL